MPRLPTQRKPHINDAEPMPRLPTQRKPYINDAEPYTAVANAAQTTHINDPGPHTAVADIARNYMAKYSWDGI